MRIGRPWCSCGRRGRPGRSAVRRRAALLLGKTGGALMVVPMAVMLGLL
ncbi:hypothetical protein NGM37_59585 [Streptomyces sp. TRM76130]|nr:hypothetical protein [Streptomyces sp. TRM76130]